MKKLIDGIFKFQFDEIHSRPNYHKELAKGQSPSTLFITCSDSRIMPHMLTQTEPGELFMLRNAGNIIPAPGTACCGEAATIEYAVSVLGVNDIIVCGHSHCGAMKGLLHTEELNDLPAVRKWLEHAESTRRLVERKCAHLDDDERLMEAVKLNVLVQLNNLSKIPAINAKLAKNQIQLHGWVYMIESGEVLSYDRTNKQFQPLFDEPLTMETIS